MVDLERAHLAYAGAGYVLGGQPLADGPSLFASPDGITWAPLTTVPQLDNCGFAGIAGGPSQALLIGCDGPWLGPAT